MQLLKNGKKWREIYMCVCVYNLLKMSQTLKQFIIWEITINNTSSLIAKKGLFYTKPFSQHFSQERWFFLAFTGRKKIFKRKTVVFQLKHSLVSSKGSENCTIFRGHLLLTIIFIQNKQYTYVSILHLQRDVFSNL